ncbi:MAG TPA: alpha/beta fold hydrolase [Chthoniobacterales bacterium]|jgi:hypothetical protein
MPLIPHSTFQPALGIGNGHLQTIWPTLFRRVPVITHDRERLELEDGDFVDLDWARHPSSRRLVILTHGLEGHSRDAGMQGMASAFFNEGWDVLAWNMRGCSGEPNRLLRFYHSGATDDLTGVIEHVADDYEQIGLVGFSLGGNITLKYLADAPAENIVTAAAFSVPCDLTSSVNQLDEPGNCIYTMRLIRSLRAKIQEKKSRFPKDLDVSGLHAMKTFHEFDSAYTAPLHGFSSAEEYWEKSSCRPVLEQISIPTLLINAVNDPFLAPDCFPIEEATRSEFLHLERPASGGHCGFVNCRAAEVSWHEARAVEFLSASYASAMRSSHLV